jgi:predicted nucleic acid-binding protein
MNMKRIYIDTSVIGGIFDEEFKEDTALFFDQLEKKEIVFVISDLLELELLNARIVVQEVLSKYPENFVERVFLSEEAIQLADFYISEKVVGKSSVEDCRHIAIATINKVDVLVSWNFKHIVNLERIRGYNSVNLKNGYSIIEIRSPKELLKNEN